MTTSPTRAFVAGAGSSLLVLAGFGLAGPPSDPLRIALVDPQQVITDSNTGRAALAELRQYGDEQQDRLRKMREAVEELRRRISEGSLSLPEDKLHELQTEREKKQQELERSVDDASREYRRRQDEELQGIERRMMPIVHQLGREGNYSLIFRRFESGLIYASDDMDITDQVIARLDRAPEPAESSPLSNAKPQATLAAPPVLSTLPPAPPPGSMAPEEILSVRLVRATPSEVLFEVRYRIASGRVEPIYLGGWLVAGGERFGGYAPALAPRAGDASELRITVSEKRTAEEIEVFLFEAGKPPFASKRFPFSHAFPGQ